MSASIDTMTLQDLLNLRSNIDTQIFKHTGEATVAPTQEPKAAVKEKAASSRAGKPACYGSFSSLIQKSHADEVAAFKAANPDVKSPHLKWVGKYLEEHKDEYALYKAKWDEEHPKEVKVKEPKVKVPKVKVPKVKEPKAKKVKEAKEGQEGAEEVPKRTLTAEHLAKLKAGREAKKAARDAEKALKEAEALADTPVQPLSEQASPVEQVSPVEQASPVENGLNGDSSSSVATVEQVEELPFKLGAATYIRLGSLNADGTNTWASGDLWLNKKGLRGAYVGELKDNGEINTDADEPSVC